MLTCDPLKETCRSHVVLIYPCLSLFLVQTKKHHHHHVAKTKTECHIYGLAICFYICQRWLSIRNWSFCQWPCWPGSDSVEVPTIGKKLFFRPKFQGISPQNMARKMVRLRTSILKWILEISHWFWVDFLPVRVCSASILPQATCHGCVVDHPLWSHGAKFSWSLSWWFVDHF